MTICKWCEEKFIEKSPRYPVVECDRCWELRWRIEDNIALAQKILYKLLRDRDRFDALTKEE